jgi:hypothetical protein
MGRLLRLRLAMTDVRGNGKCVLTEARKDGSGSGANPFQQCSSLSRARFVIASGVKQSSGASVDGWIASPPLAMTRWGRLRTNLVAYGLYSRAYC